MLLFIRMAGVFVFFVFLFCDMVFVSMYSCFLTMPALYFSMGPDMWGKMPQVSQEF